MITIAVPKGRLLDSAAEYLESRGVSIRFSDRNLVAEDVAAGVRAIQVKNSDVPVYVAEGIADIGIAGDDVIVESDFRFVHLATLPFGSTRMCLAGLRDADIDRAGGPLRVATKFGRFARRVFHERRREVHVIHLTGSVELAPVLGLAPCIVDLVETGSTLRAHNLVVLEELARIEVRLIGNLAAYKCRFQEIGAFADKVRTVE